MKLTLAFTDDLFVLWAGGGDGLEQEEALQLVLRCDVVLTQDVQDGEHPSVLQELKDVLMTRRMDMLVTRTWSRTC